MLIGERPGLSSPDSMGLYLTWNPTIGIEDSKRNCISNIRSEGLSYSEAVNKCLYLLEEAKRLNTSGIEVKDRAKDTTHNIEGKRSEIVDKSELSKQTQIFCLTNR